MKKLYRTLIVIAMAGLWLSPAYAGYYQGYVTNVMASGGKIIVTLASGAGQSTCTAIPKFYLDPNVAYDRAMLTLAITAKINQTLV